MTKVAIPLVAVDEVSTIKPLTDSQGAAYVAHVLRNMDTGALMEFISRVADEFGLIGYIRDELTSALLNTMRTNHRLVHACPICGNSKDVDELACDSCVGIAMEYADVSGPMEELTKRIKEGSVCRK